MPEDVAVVGFDDAEVGVAFTQPLPTIRQRTRLMVQLLMRLLDRELPEPMPELARDPDTAGIGSAGPRRPRDGLTVSRQGSAHG